MKNLMYAIIPLLTSQSAFALEVGDIVRVDRSQIQCQEVQQPPCHPHGYSYCDGSEGGVTATATIKAAVDGVSDLAGSVSSCAALNSLLDTVGNPVPLEVTEVTTRKFGGTRLEYLTLVLGSSSNGQVQFEGNKTF